MAHHYQPVSKAALTLRALIYPVVAGAWALLFTWVLQAILIRVDVDGVWLDLVAPIVCAFAGLRVAYTNLFYVLRRKPVQPHDGAVSDYHFESDASAPGGRA